MALSLAGKPADLRPLNPARARGLRRGRLHRAACEPLTCTPKPLTIVTPELFLALQTRRRTQRTRVVDDMIVPIRLYDVRAFKSAWVTYGYVLRLKGEGTKATSSTQLVKGLARLRPAWKIDGDDFADRDRHHRSLRRWVGDLQDMGLLRSRPGLDVNGDDARTEIELREPPAVTEHELAQARAQLKRWQSKYGEGLNTGSTSGVLDALVVGRPLNASERQRRGIARTKAAAQARREASKTNSPHHVVPPTTEKNTFKPNSPFLPLSLLADSCVTRVNENIAANADAAMMAVETASPRESGRTAAVSPVLAFDEAALLERVRARQEARRPVVELIAAQASQRAMEVFSWLVGRAWPESRLREAWVVWRFGETTAAESGPARAGRLEAGDAERLRRAAARYERHVRVRPDGFPAGALGGLAAVAEIAARRGARPQTLHYGIRVFDQLSKRMRALDTRRDDKRRQAQERRADARHQPELPIPGLRFTYRMPPVEGDGAWPVWVALDEYGTPIVIDGEVQITTGPGQRRAPEPGDQSCREVLRDAYLLAGRWAPDQVDGRMQMAGRNQPAMLQPDSLATPGPYPLPDYLLTERGDSSDRDVAELARRAAISPSEARRCPPEIRRSVLRQLRVQQQRQAAAERSELGERLYQAQQNDEA